MRKIDKQTTRAHLVLEVTWDLVLTAMFASTLLLACWLLLARAISGLASVCSWIWWIWQKLLELDQQVWMTLKQFLYTIMDLFDTLLILLVVLEQFQELLVDLTVIAVQHILA